MVRKREGNLLFFLLKCGKFFDRMLELLELYQYVEMNSREEQDSGGSYRYGKICLHNWKRKAREDYETKNTPGICRGLY